MTTSTPYTLKGLPPSTGSAFLGSKCYKRHSEIDRKHACPSSSLSGVHSQLHSYPRESLNFPKHLKLCASPDSPELLNPEAETIMTAFEARSHRLERPLTFCEPTAPKATLTP